MSDWQARLAAAVAEYHRRREFRAVPSGRELERPRAAGLRVRQREKSDRAKCPPPDPGGTP